MFVIPGTVKIQPCPNCLFMVNFVGLCGYYNKTKYLKKYVI